MKITALEQEVLIWFSDRAGNHELRSQIECAVIVSREHTGAGLFTMLSTDSSSPLVPFNCAPNAPQISSSLLPFGASVDLWLEDGRIAWLEFAAFGDASFPDGEFKFELVEC